MSKKPQITLQCYMEQRSVSTNIKDTPNLYVPALETRTLLSDSYFTQSLIADNTHTIVSANALKITTSTPPKTCYLWREELDFIPTAKQKYLLECWVYVKDTGSIASGFYLDSNFFPRYAPKIGIGVPPRTIVPTDEPVLFEILNEWEGSQNTIEKWVKIQTVFWGIDTVQDIGMYLHWETAQTHPYPFEIWVDGFTLREYEVETIKSVNIQNAFNLDIDSQEDIALTFSVEDLSVNDNAKNDFSKTITAIGTKNNHEQFEFFNSIDDNYNRLNVRAILEADTIPIIKGDLKLIEVLSRRTFSKYNDSYSVFLKGGANAWANVIAGKQLSQLQCLDYQLFRVQEVVDTFAKNAASYLSPNDSSLHSEFAPFAYFLYGDESHDFGNATTPSINLNNLRPSIFVKPLLEAIFKQAGFLAIFEGFTNTSEFTELALPYCKDEFVHYEGYLKPYVSRECYYHSRTYDADNNPNIPQIPKTTTIPLPYLFTSPLILDGENFEIAHSKFSQGFDGNYRAFFAKTSGLHKFTIYMDCEVDPSFLPVVPANYTIFADQTSFPIGYPNIQVYDDNEFFWKLTENKRGFLCEFEVNLEQCEYIEIALESLTAVWFTDQTNVFFVADCIGITYQINDGDLVNVAKIPYSNALLASGGAGGPTLERAEGWLTNALPSDCYYLPQTCMYMQAVGTHQVREGNQVYLNLNNYLPEMSQIEFVSSIAAMYDLQFVTEPTSNEVKILTKQDFEQSTDKAKDWTGKIDESEITKKPLQDEPTNYVLAYQEDSSDDLLPENFGNDTYINPYELTDKETELTSSNQFSATITQRPQTWLELPASSKYGLNQRIMRYEGFVEALGKSTYIQHSCPLQEFEVENGYPKLTFAKLSYKTENGIPGLRERFWQKQIDILLNSIILEAYFALTFLDILTIDFGVPIEISGNFYKLQSISDFRTSLDQLTKVTLLKIGAGKKNESTIVQTGSLFLFQDGDEFLFQDGNQFII